jgi:hypothetical protein
LDIIQLMVAEFESEYEVSLLMLVHVQRRPCYVFERKFARDLSESMRSLGIYIYNT